MRVDYTLIDLFVDLRHRASSSCVLQVLFEDESNNAVVAVYENFGVGAVLLVGDSMFLDGDDLCGRIATPIFSNRKFGENVADWSMEWANSLCGNGGVNSGEQCDGTNLNNAECDDDPASVGHIGGNLRCYGNCTFDTRGCWETPPTRWGCASGRRVFHNDQSFAIDGHWFTELYAIVEKRNGKIECAETFNASYLATKDVFITGGCKLQYDSASLTAEKSHVINSLNRATPNAF